VVTEAYPLAQLAGDLNIVVVGWNDVSASVKSVTDSAGNIYALAIGPTRGTRGPAKLSQSIYYARNIVGGANTVTVTFTKPALYADVRIAEYQGLNLQNPLDVAVGKTGTSTSASSGAKTTTAPNELIFGAGMTFGVYTSAGSGFALRDGVTQYGDIIEDKTVATKGSYSATATTRAGKNRVVFWLMQMVTFRAATSTP
jgi:hypothetical protein